METYFISDGEWIKIGRSRNVLNRLKDLQSVTPRKLVLLRVIEGDYERRFHTMYAKYRVQGEWFKMPLAEDFMLFAAIRFHDEESFAGDLVRDAMQDRRWPDVTTTYFRADNRSLPRDYQTMKFHITMEGACREAHEGLYMAYREWQKFKRILTVQGLPNALERQK